MNEGSALQVHTMCDKQKWELDDVVNADTECLLKMFTSKERPLVNFFQYTRIFLVSRGSPQATNKSLFLFYHPSNLITNTIPPPLTMFDDLGYKIPLKEAASLCRNFLL